MWQQQSVAHSTKTIFADLFESNFLDKDYLTTVDWKFQQSVLNVNINYLGMT